MVSAVMIESSFVSKAVIMVASSSIFWSTFLSTICKC